MIPKATDGSSPKEALETLASSAGLEIASDDFAKHLDSIDPLREFRKRFAYPKYYY